MRRKAKITVKKAFTGFAVGHVEEIEVDAEGTPLNPMWRRRYRDSKIDNCLEIATPSSAPTKTTKKGD